MQQLGLLAKGTSGVWETAAGRGAGKTLTATKSYVRFPAMNAVEPPFGSRLIPDIQCRRWLKGVANLQLQCQDGSFFLVYDFKPSCKRRMACQHALRPEFL